VKNIIKDLAEALNRTVDVLYKKGAFKKPYDVVENDIIVPRERGHGELCTPILSRIPSDLPREKLFDQFSKTLAVMLENMGFSYVERIVPVPPVFLNFFLKPEVFTESLKVIIKNEDYGIEKTGQGRKVLLEFVSANPTGPLTVAHGRQAAFGEALARILEVCGYRVDREYYLNDEGRQIDLLGESLKVRYRQIFGEELSIPEDGYQGDYLIDIAKELAKQHGANLKKKETDFFSKTATEEILRDIENDLSNFGVRFDSFQSQEELTKTGQVSETLEILEKTGATYTSEGALFLKTTPSGDDKDRVLRKKDGSYTYLAPDLAYHRKKFLRSYDLMINLWGPDHFGYVRRLLAGLAAMGFDVGKVKIIIVQLTTLYRGKERVRMSTRQGEFLPLSLLARELSTDVARFFFLSRKANSHLDFDLELAKKDSPENPIFYLQYASARIASLFRHQKEKMPDVDPDPDKAPLEMLKESEEMEMMLMLSRFGAAVNSAGQSLEPQVLFAYLLSLVKVFHQYYQRCQIIGPDREMALARLALVSGVEKVLKKGLFLLNVHAPDKM